MLTVEKLHTNNWESVLASCEAFLTFTKRGVFDIGYARNLLINLNDVGFVRSVHDDGEHLGILLGTCCPRWHDGLTVAVELALWIDDGKRGRGGAKALIDAFETWAAENGAAQIVMSDLAMAPVGEAVFRPRGYYELETMWVKSC